MLPVKRASVNCFCFNFLLLVWGFVCFWEHVNFRVTRKNTCNIRFDFSRFVFFQMGHLYALHTDSLRPYEGVFHEGVVKFRRQIEAGKTNVMEIWESSQLGCYEMSRKMGA